MPMDSSGYVARRAADYLTLMYDALEASTGHTFDRTNTASSFIGALLTILAVLLAQLDESAQQVYDAMDPNNATGAALDNQLALVGLTRREATFSVVSCLLGASSNACFIPAGTLIQGGGTDGKARWALLEDVTPDDWIYFEELEQYQVESALFQCTAPGPITAPGGAVQTIVEPKQFWVAVLNVTAATVGSALESDAAARQRRAASLQGAGSRTIGAMRAAIMGVDGVESCVIVENTSTEEAVIDGITMPGCSVCAVIYPDTLTTAQQEAVAAVIYDSLAAGVRSAGDESATVTGSDGEAKTIRWQYPTEVTANIVYTIRLRPGYEEADVEGPIETDTTTTIGALGAGESAELQALWAILFNTEGVVGQSITINGVAANLDCAGTEIIVPGTVTVTVAP